MTEERRLLSPAEAANLLGVSIYTLYGWTSMKKVPFRKVGSLLRFDMMELMDWTKVGSGLSKKTVDPMP